MQEIPTKPKRLIRRIYDLIAEKRFPAPVPIGARAVAWGESEVDTVTVGKSKIEFWHSGG